VEKLLYIFCRTKVPASFNDLPAKIKEVYESLNIPAIEEPELKTVPKTRKSKNFICTISDDRGDEATYAGFPISSVATPDTGKGIGDVVSLLWFKKTVSKMGYGFHRNSYENSC
jgi:ATP-citrate lyase alpha-subunit